MNILKRSAVWGTALKDKLASDIFFSTRAKIIACLIVFAAIIIASFILLLEHIKGVLMTGMIESLLLAVNDGFADPLILADSNYAAEVATWGAITVVVFFAALTGIVVSRLALAPITHAFHIQKRFISGIAHELRTPLSILRMNNEVARFGLEPSSPLLPILEENIADIDTINEILNNLLLFDRMVSIDSLQFEELDPGNIAAAVAVRLGPLARQKEITLEVSKVTMPRILGNKTALEQVFFNILKNAVSYTPVGGKVSVQYAGADEESVLIRIADSGVGIPPKDLRHIFEPFYRSEKTGKLSGTGIGLAIVYEIMKLHKGSIDVESIEGKGTTFTLSFPIGRTLLHESKAADLSRVSYSFSNKKPS